GIGNVDGSHKGVIIGTTLRDFGIEGISGGTTGHGLYFRVLNHLSVRNMFIQYCNSGIYLDRQGFVGPAQPDEYGHQIVLENIKSILNRRYGLETFDQAALGPASIITCSWEYNTLGGVYCATSPFTFIGGIIVGNA